MEVVRKGYTKLPITSTCALDAGVVLLAGGGGAAKTGVPNGMDGVDLKSVHEFVNQSASSDDLLLPPFEAFRTEDERIIDAKTMPGEAARIMATTPKRLLVLEYRQGMRSSGKGKHSGRSQNEAVKTNEKSSKSEAGDDSEKPRATGSMRVVMEAPLGEASPEDLERVIVCAVGSRLYMVAKGKVWGFSGQSGQASSLKVVCQVPEPAISGGELKAVVWSSDDVCDEIEGKKLPKESRDCLVLNMTKKLVSFCPTGAARVRVLPLPSQERTARFSSVCRHPEGGIVASVATRSESQLYKWNPGKMDGVDQPFARVNGGVTCLSAQGQTLVVGTSDGKVRVLNLSKGSVVASLRQPSHDLAVTSASISHGYIVTASIDKSFAVHRLTGGNATALGAASFLIMLIVALLLLLAWFYARDTLRDMYQEEEFDGHSDL